MQRTRPNAHAKLAAQAKAALDHRERRQRANDLVGKAAAVTN